MQDSAEFQPALRKDFRRPSGSEISNADYPLGLKGACHGSQVFVTGGK
jgi:hypothetical protein